MREERWVDEVPAGGEDQGDGGLADQAQQRVQPVADQARSRAREQVEQRSAHLGARAGGVAEDLRGMAEYFRSQGRKEPANVAEQAAKRVSDAAQYLRGSDGDRLLRDAEAVARRRPWVVVVGGVAAGMAGLAVLKGVE